MREWTSKWNPFNSDKLLAHIYRWREIKKGNNIPQPVTVTVDPINKCDMKCKWCNSNYILNQNDKKINSSVLKEIPHFLSEWQTNPDIKKGIESICIAGGGEPLLHPNIGDFIEIAHEVKIETGIVTNGTNIDKLVDNLLNCTWVGVSIDAGTKETYLKLKGQDKFEKVIGNIRALIERLNSNPSSPLGQEGWGPGVSYKYLLHPRNVSEVFKAAEIAKEIGCKNMHIRPYGESWDKLRQIKTPFSFSDIEEYRKQLKQAIKLEDASFQVFGITHKFDGNFRKSNDFKSCHAIFMTGVIMPPRDNGKFDYGLCCDRRGDEDLTLHNLSDFDEVKRFWGSNKHWEAFNKINVSKCPRCTYQPHNIIYENVISINNTTYQFI